MDQVNINQTRIGAQPIDYDKCQNISFRHGHNRHNT